MSLVTDLSVAPYVDDYDANKDYYKVLFKPGPAVQVRELNQLQTLLQAQVERFGDNIFKRGTIVDGCQFTFYDNYQYVKLNDADNTGEAINVNNFDGLFLTDESSGVVARINKTEQGFEATAPDLNTVYVSYIKAGGSGEMLFTAGSNLLVTDLDRTLNGFELQNNVGGFSNNDIVVISPALAVQNSTGGQAFSNGALLSDVLVPGQVVTQNLNTGEAKAVIVSISPNSAAGALTLRVRPLANSLVGNAFSNGLFLTENSFEANASVPLVANGNEVYITSVIGSGAMGSVTTTTSGRLEAGSDSLTVMAPGEGYFVAPYVSVASKTANTSQVAALQINAKNYFARVLVANSENHPIGAGYAFNVTEGYIYQKGYFARVAPQTILVEKYNTKNQGYPDQKAVGFDTIESIVNSNADFSLLDPANTGNATAPGADRLKLTPTLVVKPLEEAKANTEFFTIVEFARGIPYKQVQDSRYNAIENNMAKRTYDASGDFVTDRFIVSSISAANAAFDATSFDITVDPGTAYIAGRRVQTSNNYTVAARKGTDTVKTANVNIDVNLGNYVDVRGVAGTFPASKMVKVDLYDTPADYYSAAAGTAITAAGNKIGTARIRGITASGNAQALPTSTYRIYLFDVAMDTGKNFSSVKSIFYNGATFKAVGDIHGVAQLRDPSNSYLVFRNKVSATKTLSSANLEFTARTSQANAAANGLSNSATIVLSAGANARFPYNGQLTDAQKAELIITPNATIRANTSITGTVTGSSGANTLTGTGTTFVTELFPGAFLQLGAQVRQVVSISNNTSLTVSSNFSGAVSGNAQIVLPKDIPVPLVSIPGATASVSGNTTLNIGLGFVTNTASFGAGVTYNVVKNQSSAAAAKSAVRSAFVKVNLGTHSDGTKGPWCLGAPDVFRLRTVTRSGEDVTQSFYIDNNHNENYVDLSYLVYRPGSKFKLTSADELLVEFDYFQNPADRPFTIDSYSINDAVNPLLGGSAVHTAEIPEFYSIQGEYYDLRDTIDFRPTVVATANLSANSTTATVNPAETRNLDETLDKNVPAPQSDLTFSIEHYMGRADRVIVSANGSIQVIEGKPSRDYAVRAAPEETITIDVLNVAPYPSVPLNMSATVQAIYDTKIGSERYSSTRLSSYRTRTSPNFRMTTAQNKRYSMADIAKMDRRLDNVEKAMTLSLAEQEISNLVIPSTLDSSQPRFKFGFAVDNFENLRLSDTTNPQFAANIFGGRLTPRKKQLRVSVVDSAGDKLLSLPRADDFRLVYQSQATDGPVQLPEPPIAPPKEPEVPVMPPEPPVMPITLDVIGDVNHVCGLVPGGNYQVVMYHPISRHIYTTLWATASAEGCINVPMIYTPPPPPPVVVPPPVIVTPPVVEPQPPVLPPIIVEVKPDPPAPPPPPPPPPVPPVPPVVPPPPVVVPPPPPPVVVPAPEPYNPPMVGGGDFVVGGGWGGAGGGFGDLGVTGWLDQLWMHDVPVIHRTGSSHLMDRVRD